MTRWETLQVTFATMGQDWSKRPPWERTPERPQLLRDERQWLDIVGEDGWELVAISDTFVIGYTGYMRSSFDGKWYESTGGIPAMRWTFKREVPT